MLAGTIGSRPIGTAANARARAYIIDQLRLFGFDVRVQEADAGARRSDAPRASPTSSPSRQGSRPEAVGARLLTTIRSPLVRAPRTMRSVWRVSLEAARVLAARTDPTWTLMVLLTDGEECGTDGRRGARDRPRRHAPAATPTSTSNRSAPPARRCSSRPAPATAGCCRPWARSAPHPRGGSFVSEIYRRLPNDTDFSILKLHEIPGLNFAAVGDGYAYHTARDTPERLSPATLRHTGEQVVDARDRARQRGHHAAIDSRSARSSTSPACRRSSYGPMTGLAIAHRGARASASSRGSRSRRRRCGCEGFLRWLLTVRLDRDRIGAGGRRR